MTVNLVWSLKNIKVVRVTCNDVFKDPADMLLLKEADPDEDNYCFVEIDVSANFSQAVTGINIDKVGIRISKNELIRMLRDGSSFMENLSFAVS